MSTYASDPFICTSVTNTINLFLRKKKVLWVDLAQVFIFNTWKQKSTKIFKYEALKIVEIWDEQIKTGLMVAFFISQPSTA